MFLGMAGAESPMCFEIGQDDPLRLGGASFTAGVSGTISMGSGASVCRYGWGNVGVWRFFARKRLAVCTFRADDACWSDIRVSVASFLHQTPPYGGTHCDEPCICRVVFRLLPAEGVSMGTYYSDGGFCV